jgi:hypothetical protein
LSVSGSSCLTPKAGWLRTEQKTTVPTQIYEYAHELKLNGRTESTIKTTIERLTRLSKDADINNPYKVKEFLCNAKWKNSSKHTIATIYTGYIRFIGKDWKKPTYKPEESIYFIPNENEIDRLIAASSKNFTATTISKRDSHKNRRSSKNRMERYRHTKQNSSNKQTRKRKSTKTHTNLRQTNPDATNTKRNNTKHIYANKTWIPNKF